MAQLKNVAQERKDYEDRLAKNLVERAKLLNRAFKDVAFQSILLAKCKQDILFWFQYFAFTQNIKGFSTLPGEAIPFLLFAFQVEFVLGMWENIMDGTRPIAERMRALDILVEKSRQMGITWLVDAVFCYGFLFYNHSYLIISRSEEEVDNGTEDSNFGKIRLILKNLPKWMLPPGFSKTKGGPGNTHMLITRADGVGNIVGRTAHPDSGRGSTKNAVFLDEMAFMQYASRIKKAATNTTACLIGVSTPNGEFGEFYSMRSKAKKGMIDGYSFHWSEHPFYDEKWYDTECARSSPEAIAQELDINYTASVRGRVYPEFREPDVSMGVANQYRYDPKLPVYVSIDNSHGGTDPHAVIVAQKDWNGRIRIIDGYQSEPNVAPDKMASLMAKRPLSGWVLDDVAIEFVERLKMYSTPIYIGDPYDTDAAMGNTTIRKEYAKYGINLICPRMLDKGYGKLTEQIRITKMAFPRISVYYDSENPEDTPLAPFVWAIQSARYPGKEDEVTDKFISSSKDPVHDMTSHYRTALEYLMTFFHQENEHEESADELKRNRISKPKPKKFNPTTGNYS